MFFLLRLSDPVDVAPEKYALDEEPNPVAARRRSYEGCFGVDVTCYLSDPELAVDPVRLSWIPCARSQPFSLERSSWNGLTELLCPEAC